MTTTLQWGHQLPDDVWAAFLVAKLAQVLGLPPGTLWEPPMVRWLETQLVSYDRNAVLAKACKNLGLKLEVLGQ